MAKSKRSHIQKKHRKALADKIAPLVADRVAALHDKLMRACGSEPMPHPEGSNAPTVPRTLTTDGKPKPRSLQEQLGIKNYPSGVIQKKFSVKRSIKKGGTAPNN